MAQVRAEIADIEAIGGLVYPFMRTEVCLASSYLAWRGTGRIFMFEIHSRTAA